MSKLEKLTEISMDKSNDIGFKLGTKVTKSIKNTTNFVIFLSVGTIFTIFAFFNGLVKGISDNEIH